MATSTGATARGRRTPCLRPVLAGVTVVAAVLLGGCSGAGDGSAPDPAGPGMVAARTHVAGPEMTLTRTTWGGLCPEGPCRSELVVDGDGAWRYEAQDGSEQGRLSGAELDRLRRAVLATRLSEDGPTSTHCAADSDGRSVAYSWTVGGESRRVDSCEVAVDADDPLVVELEGLAARVTG